MFAKFFQKLTAPEHQSHQGVLRSADVDPRVIFHYGIPSTASIMAFDPIQSLIAIGTSDGRIKVIGGNNIEGLLVSPKNLPFKNLEFLHNQGFLVSVSNENDVQVWDLGKRKITSTLKWESNITALSVIQGTGYMYIGDEHGMVFVTKYNAEEGKLEHTSYYVPTDDIAEAAEISSPSDLSVVGILPQPCSQGNRLLIAYGIGLIVIWDVSEDRVVFCGSNKDIQLKDKTVASSREKSDEPLEKEISSLCWASHDGSILAVGYVDGDIMFWNLSSTVSKKNKHSEKPLISLAKLQLSSSNKRVPVIVLHCSTRRFSKNRGCQLFVYGGDEIGSKEVLTVLSVEWSSGIESLKCISRVDIALTGSFANIVFSSWGGMENGGDLLFLLTNPGKLDIYDDARLSALVSNQEKTSHVSPIQYLRPVPTVDPHMTVCKLGLVERDGELSKALSKMMSAAKVKAPNMPTTKSVEWPLSGGIPNLLSEDADYQVERVYAAGYQDGSVRIWDATCPALSLIFTLSSKVEGIDVAPARASVSALDICTSTSSLATGDECGMVHLYQLIESSEEVNLIIVTEANREVHKLHKRDGPRCKAMFSLVKSPISVLLFANSGTRLAVGFACGRVAILDINTLSLLFLTESLPDSKFPVISLDLKSFLDSNSKGNSPENSVSKGLNDQEKCALFVMTKNANIAVLDGISGKAIKSPSRIPDTESTAISMFIIEDGGVICEEPNEKNSPKTPQTSKTSESEPEKSVSDRGITPTEGELESKAEVAYFGQISKLRVLFCFEHALHLYSMKSLVQGRDDSIKKVKLSKPCCWTAALRKAEKLCGLVLLYQTGVLEIRSFTTLEVIGEVSLISILRWSLKTNVEKTICSSSRGQMMLVNECEFTTLSLLAYENDFRIPDSLPCLHDEVLAAGYDATAIPSSQEINQDDLSHLEKIFSYPPFLKPSDDNDDGGKVKEINLKIDEIRIDEPIVMASIPEKITYVRKDKEKEREELFEGATVNAKPEMRTTDEIRAKYRGTEDAAAAAARARERLMERKEKLQRLDERTQELQNGAEDFASMASQLAKKMERRKWWQI